MDQLLEMYMEDRCHFNALSSLLITNNHNPSSACQNTSHHDRPPSPPPPSGQTGTTELGLPPLTTFARKPILVDKQSSEPNTPVSKTFERPITRGDSDLSQRFVKKRVTLRHSLGTSVPETPNSSAACRCGSAGSYQVNQLNTSTRNVRSESSLSCAIPSNTPATSGLERSSYRILGEVTATAVASTSSSSGGHSRRLDSESQDRDSVSTLVSSADSGEHEVLSEGSLFGPEQATSSSYTSDPECCGGRAHDAGGHKSELTGDNDNLMQKSKTSHQYKANRFTLNQTDSFNIITPSFSILPPPPSAHSSTLVTSSHGLPSPSSSSVVITSSSSSSSSSIVPSFGNISSFNQLFQSPSSESINKNDDSDCDISTTTVIHKSDHRCGRESSSSGPSPTDSLNRTTLANRYHHPHHHHHVPHRRQRAGHHHSALKEPENL